ncbi:MAG: SDR family NAD(P)-dependent oxidoreductase [Myxococcota bacterium]
MKTSKLTTGDPLRLLLPAPGDAGNAKPTESGALIVPAQPTTFAGAAAESLTASSSGQESSSGPTARAGLLRFEHQHLTTLPNMKAAAGVARPAIQGGPSSSLRPQAVWSTPDDPFFSLHQLQLAAGQAGAIGPLAQDLRLILQHGSLSVDLEGRTLTLHAGDSIDLPRGAELSLHSDAGAGLFLLGHPRADFDRRGRPDPEAEPKLDLAKSLVERDQGNGEGCTITVLQNDAAHPELSISLAKLGPGTTTALHALSVDERYVVERGEGIVELDGKRSYVRAGDVVHIPAKTAQRITNTGAEALAFYCACTPRFEPSTYAAVETTAPAPKPISVVPLFNGGAARPHLGKNAVVTGGNRGIGLETCRQLGAQGFHVILAARDPVAGKAAAAQLQKEGFDVEFRALDVADTASIQQFVAALSKDPKLSGALDVLVNNAGICLDAPGQTVKDLAAATAQTQATNVQGPAALTEGLLPLLARSKTKGRVINLSTALTRKDWAGTGFDIYRASKRALNEQTLRLAAKTPSISACCVNPGWVQTDMGGKTRAPDSPNLGVQSILWLATAEAPPTGAFVERAPGVELPPGMVGLASQNLLEL